MDNGYMLGISKKRFLVTLGLSILVWMVSMVVQVYSTFGKSIGTFSTGCRVTGYPIDGCMIQGSYIPPILIMMINITFWFWVIHLFWSWVDKKGSNKP